MKIFLMILSYLIIGLLAGVSIFIRTNQIGSSEEFIQKAKSKILGPCSVPLSYTVGDVDPRFGISQEDFLKEIQAAEGVWEKATGRDLFDYNPTSNFKINLVYDERQERTEEFKKLQDELGKVEDVQKDIKGQYDSLSAVYKKKLAAYNQSVDAYKKDLKSYETEVSYWNSRGGAPEDKYNELEDEQKNLEKTRAQLEKERKAINDLVAQINALSKKEKQAVSGYNQQVSTYTQQYGGPREFDQGVYTGSEVDIYQFNEDSDLELVLAHELGHYLGLDHDRNSKSIMYYLIGDQDLNNIVPTEEDLEAIGGVCK